MTDHPRGAAVPTRRASLPHLPEAVRIVALLIALVALVLTSSAFGWVSSARAADEEPVAPKKAVIVSGPVHSLTYRYRDYARAIADAAEAHGMDVIRLLYPNATPLRVKKFAQGADLFVYVGHGNGWPSDFGPFQEATKNGLGLSPEDPDKRTTSNVVYKGADWLRANIVLAPNAVTILNHLSYASGNASTGLAYPSRDVAVQRVDNFANGFLSIGARVVWALGWQPGADVVDALFEEDATMDAVFMTRYRSGVNPLNGWIGDSPSYHASVRVPGARIHVDPDPTYRFLRAITGDLGFTTTEWRDASAVPPDTEPPVISEVSVDQPPATVATGDAALPVFTPNGDGLSDTITIWHRLSENAFLEMRIFKDGDLVREMSVWSMRGRGKTSWDGRRTAGGYVGEGRFRIELTPVDRAGNRGEPASVRVLVLNSMKAPSATPVLFYAADGDALAATTRLRARLSRPATLAWLIRDAAGQVVRHGDAIEAQEAGTVSVTWDGTDDAGQFLPDGRYTGRLVVTRPEGSYGHDVTVRLMPYQLVPSAWSVRRGGTLRLQVTTAEPLKAKPTITARVPGRGSVALKVRRVDDDTYKASLVTRSRDRRGTIRITASATNSGEGSQEATWRIRLQ